MKTVKHLLLILALPILMISSANANGHHDKDRNEHDSDHHDNDHHDRDHHENDNDHHDVDDRDGGSGGNGGPTVPIDAGITILLAAGIGLGAKKLADRKKQKDSISQ